MFYIFYNFYLFTCAQHLYAYNICRYHCCIITKWEWVLRLLSRGMFKSFFESHALHRNFVYVSHCAEQFSVIKWITINRMRGRNCTLTKKSALRNRNRCLCTFFVIFFFFLHFTPDAKLFAAKYINVAFWLGVNRSNDQIK